MGQLVCRKLLLVSVEDDCLVLEECGLLRSYNSSTELWLLLHLDGRLEVPDPINRLVKGLSEIF